MADFSPFARIWRDQTGSTVIETALIAPVLILLSIGTFDVSRMMARQSELQKAANEASDIVLAAEPTTEAKRATLESILEASTGLPTSKVVVTVAYRCDTDATYVTDATACSNQDTVTTYIKIVMTDDYTPMWTNFGIKGAFAYNVTRQVQIS